VLSGETTALFRELGIKPSTNPFISGPIPILTNLPERDVGFARLEIKYQRTQITSQVLSDWCKSLKSSFGDGIPPLIISNLRFEYSLGDSTECLVNAKAALIGEAHPAFIQLPIALLAPVFLTRADIRPSAWLIPAHFAIASLRQVPEGFDGGQAASSIRYVTVEILTSQCEANSVQPQPDELQASLEIAECIYTDSLGRRKVGRFVRHYERVPEKKLTPIERWQPLRFDRAQAGSTLKNWSEVDTEFKGGALDTAIKIVVATADFDPEGGPDDLIYHLCLQLPGLKSYLRQNYRAFMEYMALGCKWRRDVVRFESIPRWSRLERQQVVLTWLGSYINSIKQDRLDFELMPIVFEAQERSPLSLLTQIIQGKYPGELIWLYVPPDALKSKNVREYIEAAISKGSRADYDGRLANIGDIRAILNGKKMKSD
jgi:hypothetical protein